MIRARAAAPRARPVLKWAGGKGQLLPELLRRVPASFGTYHEPFVGAGALFFELAARGRIGRAVLSDINGSLVDVYRALRDSVDDVVDLLREHRYEEPYYYALRARDPAQLSLAERAARTIYLNKTCYNGLYRENRSGQFNVPFGRYSNPTILDEPNIRAAARALQGVEIRRQHFAEVLGSARAGDLVYFDPPYHPVSATACFTAYDRAGFGPADQVRLRDVFAELAGDGVCAMLSNSDTPAVRELYARWDGGPGGAVHRVLASRALNSRADRRGKVAELIVCNYAPPRHAHTGAT